MELEVVRYRVRLIQSDLELESGIQFGSGLNKAPLEEELHDLETQLENNALNAIKRKDCESSPGRINEKIMRMEYTLD